MPAINSGRIWLPQTTISTTQGTVASINQAGDLAMLGCQIPQTGNVTGLKFATQTVTTGCDIRGSLQTLTSGSINSGTLIDANASGTVTVANSDDATIKTVTFTAPVAVTKGTNVALVLDISSGTPSALQIKTNVNQSPTSLPYSYKVQTGVGSFTTHVINACLTYDTGDVAIEGTMCYSTAANQAISTSTTPDEIGMKFTMPYSARSDGYVFRMIAPGGAVALNMNLYDVSSGSVVATAALDPNIMVGTGLTSWITGFWNTAVDLLKGRSYRVVFTPTTTTSWTITQKGSGVVLFPGDGDTAPAFTSRVNAGSWTDDATMFIPIGITIDKIYQAGGSYF